MSGVPIFIVGAPRSGTTLVAAMLSAHPRVDVGPETFFFRRLPRDPSRLLEPSTWPEPATAFVTSLRLGIGPLVHELFGVPEARVRAFLADREPSVAAMLESLTVAHASDAGKPRWAEKSPRHIADVPRIRRAFPDAAIVRVVRDPRDVALSRTKVPHGSPIVVSNLYDVARFDRRSGARVARDPSLLTVRFEDLVREPEAQLRRVCEAIGEDFDPAMVAPERSITGLVSDHETWKQSASGALDASRVEAWRREMSAEDRRAAAVICREMILRDGYDPDADERADGTARRLVVRPGGRAFVERQHETVRTLAAAGVLLDGPRGRAGAAVYWPDPGRDPWRFGRRRTRRIRRLAGFTRTLVAHRVRGRRTIAIAIEGQAASTKPDLASRVATGMVHSLGTTMSPTGLVTSMTTADRGNGDSLARDD